MILIKLIYYKLKNIDSMYYEVLCYAILTGLIAGGFHWIVGM